MGKIAFVFAGQGAQNVGMGQDLYESSAAARRIFDQGEAEVPGLLAYCFDGPEEALNQTINTQPCLFLTDLACAAALTENGVTPEGVAGFSLGEVPAAHFAGLFSFKAALAFVSKRAVTMESCAQRNPGAMFAVLRLKAEVVEALCAGLEEAFPVNYNCPGQTVVACAQESAAALQKAVAAQGGKALRLNVSGAFHSPFMREAGTVLADYLRRETFTAGTMPVYANLTAQPYGDARRLLADQVTQPVLWQKTIENMLGDGFDSFVEVGPGKVLAGLIKKTAPAARVFSVQDTVSLQEVVTNLKEER